MSGGTRQPPRGATAHCRAWSAEDDAHLSARYGKDQGAAIARDLGRSEISVFHRARRLGLAARRRWTAADDRTLSMEWGDRTVVGISRLMDRTPEAIYERARNIGLVVGCPDGFEYLTASAARTGFANATFRMILQWAGVQLRRSMSRPARGIRRPTHIVDTADVDDAVERWLATETLEGAAEARGIGSTRLRNVLAEFGRNVPPKPETFRVHWRIPTAVIDEALAAWRATETLMDAAARRGIKRWKLHAMLTRAGVARPPSKTWRVPTREVDRVVAEARRAA